MSAPAQLIQLTAKDGPAWAAVGDVYRVLASGAQTGGAYALCEAVVAPGGGPPPHIHRREDEAFFVLQGEITFTIEGRRIVAGAGSFVQGPRNIAHAFKNEGSLPARMLVLTAPSGFENFLAAFATPVASIDAPPVPVSPDEIKRLLAAAPQFGIEILPPPH